MKNKIKIDRNAFSVVSSEDQDVEEKTYWHDKTSNERLEALETARQMIYGYNPDTTRLQRVFEVVEMVNFRRVLIIRIRFGGWCGS